MAVLALAKLFRPGDAEGDRHHYDFVVDGVSLFELTSASSRGLIGLLGWCSKDIDRKLVKSLLLEEATDLGNNRQSLFVCHLCGDVGCGAITTGISKSSGTITWREFRFENNWDPDMTEHESYASIGPFEFDEDQYNAALKSALL